jgi:uncharacterized protein (TIGR03000 family)
MVHKIFAKFTASAVVALALFAWTGQANAFHHRWHGSSGGGWGSSGGGWGSSGGGWGSSGGGWGSSGGGWGSSGGGWGSSGGYGGYGGHWGHKSWRGGSSGGSWGSSGGYWGGSSGGWGSSGGGSSGGTYYYAPGVDMTPVDPSVAPPAGAPPAGVVPPAPAPGPAPGSPTSTMRTDGLLSVTVPDDAKIFVNGQPTTSLGDVRHFVSRDLQPGFNYTYEVKAEAIRGGRMIERVKKVDLRAGESANLAFDFEADSASTETSLTLHVPSDAKVFLAGNVTKAAGETRIFRTTGLSGAQNWDGYTIRVEVERGGRTLTKEETISLKAGQSKEMQFDFDGDKVASSR